MQRSMSSQLSWAGQYKKYVQYNFKFTLVYSAMAVYSLHCVHGRTKGPVEFVYTVHCTLYIAEQKDQLSLCALKTIDPSLSSKPRMCPPRSKFLVTGLHQP